MSAQIIYVSEFIRSTGKISYYRIEAATFTDRRDSGRWFSRYKQTTLRIFARHTEQQAFQLFEVVNKVTGSMPEVKNVTLQEFYKEVNFNSRKKQFPYGEDYIL